MSATATAGSPPALLPALLTVDEVATLLNCAPRTVYRFADGGRIPRPIKLGGLVRWNRAELESFLASGCPSCRPGKGAAQ